MRIVVTGATGFVGRALVSALTDRNHHVVVLSRNPHRAATQLPLVAAHFAWNPLVEIAPREALRGADAIIHLAGEPVVGRWTPAKKAAIRDSRVLGTRHLVAALENLDDRPCQLVAASAIGFYGDRGEEALDESSRPGDDFLATTCVEWEHENAAAMDHDLRVAHLRIGLVLERDGGALGAMLPAFQLGIGGPLGDGQQWWSWIHRMDLVRMLVKATEEGWCGAFNATAPHPVRQSEFSRILARGLGRPSVIPAPAFALRLLLGEFSTELLSSKKVLPVATQATGFDFHFGELDAALSDLLD